MPRHTATSPSAAVERADRAPTRFRWPARLVALLGRLPDVVVALRARVAAPTVAAERQRRGIKAFVPRGPLVDWTPEMDALVGTATDAAVAAALGIGSGGSVAHRRHVLGIPAVGPGGPRPRPMRWSRRALAMLGKAPDAEVAKRLGLTQSIVWKKRTELAIRAHRSHPPRARWPREAVRLLGRRPDREVARKLGVSVQAVLRKRRALGIPGYRWGRPVVRTAALKRLLKLPNRVLRAKHGLSSALAQKLRRQYGIRASGSQPPRWTDAVVSRLGREPDSRIARDLGISSSSVLSKRRTLAIPRWVRHRWTAAQRRWLGRLSDREIARRLGVSSRLVRTERRRLGVNIPAVVERPRRRPY
jgi:DNA-binding CsgD family transcriptional regulator